MRLKCIEILTDIKGSPIINMGTVLPTLEIMLRNAMIFHIGLMVNT